LTTEIFGNKKRNRPSLINQKSGVGSLEQNMFQRNLVGLQQMQNESICEIEAKLGEQMLLKKRVRKELQKFSHKAL